MGKLGGFLEIQRQEKELREISDRIKDFNEIDIPLNNDYIKTQAARQWRMEKSIGFVTFN